MSQSNFCNSFPSLIGSTIFSVPSCFPSPKSCIDYLSSTSKHYPTFQVLRRRSIPETKLSHQGKILLAFHWPTKKSINEGDPACIEQYLWQYQAHVRSAAPQGSTSYCINCEILTSAFLWSTKTGESRLPQRIIRHQSSSHFQHPSKRGRF